MALLLSFLVACWLGFALSEPVVDLPIRLVKGPDGCSGRLEVQHNGQWGTVCNDEWDIRDTKVACRQLGCGRPLSASKCEGFGTGKEKIPIWLDDVKCTGRESTLAKCKANKLGEHDCTHREDIGIECMEPVTVRLADGPDACTGRLEVYYKKEWGTVCNDHWDLNDAKVVCKQLACEKAQQPKKRRSRYGKAEGRIWLDDVACRGDELSLEHCKHRVWGYHDCTHREDVSVSCSELSEPDVVQMSRLASLQSQLQELSEPDVVQMSRLASLQSQLAELSEPDLVQMSRLASLQSQLEDTAEPES